MYKLYMKGVRFPIPPDKLTIKVKNKNKTVDIMNGGELNIVKMAGLTEISFDLLLPMSKYPFAVYPDGFHRADYYMTIIENLKKNKSKFQFILMRYTPSGKQLYKTNIKCTLEDYSLVEDAQDGGFDTTVSLKLKKYVAYPTKTITIAPTIEIGTAAAVTSTEARAESSTAEQPAGRAYTIVQGDTLCGISRKFYGTETRWTEIYNANSAVIEATAQSHGKGSSSNGHWIYECQITIP